MPTLFIVATPIGNLGDISFRALDTLRSVDCILCEDTRVTKKLLAKYSIQKPTISYHQHSGAVKIQLVLGMLAEGKHIALVSDAGTPGISDPGGALVEAVVKKFGDSVRIVPIPGANAVLCALSVSGFPADKFVFLGFPPHKKGRKKFFAEIAEIPYTVALYESKHRIAKTLAELAGSIGDRQVMIARELTKQFETLYRGTAGECLKKLQADKSLGEFVIVIRAK